MKKIVMYTSHTCSYCERAERLLHQLGMSDIEKIFVDDNPQERETMVQRTGARSVPQIFIGEEHIGGYSDLAAKYK